MKEDIFDKIAEAIVEVAKNNPGIKPDKPFVDDVLGEFKFDVNLGWTKNIELGGQECELLLGYIEEPSEELVTQARTWVANWDDQWEKITAFLRAEFDKWTGNEEVPKLEELRLESLCFLWPDVPQVCVVFLESEDGIKLYGITFEEFTPKKLEIED